MQHTIYGLYHPVTGELRYVGVTKSPTAQRLAKHVWSAGNGCVYPLHCWMRKLAVGGMKPQLHEIERTEDRTREVYWIAHHRSLGTRLLNCTDGGEGVVNPSAESRAKLSRANLGRKHSEETRKKISEVQKGRVLSEEHKQKIGMSQKGKPGKPHSPETRAKISAIQTGTKRGPRSDETKAILRAQRLGVPRSAECIAKMSASKMGKRSSRIYGPLSDETKDKISESKTGKVFGPMPAERRANISLGKKRKFAERKAMKTLSSEHPPIEG